MNSRRRENFVLFAFAVALVVLAVLVLVGEV